MALHPKIQLSRLRDIGWNLWDPIGLGLPDGAWPEGCADEYDRYLLHAISMMCRGGSRREVSSYLVRIATEHMGLSHVDSGAAAATANAIGDYLETLQDGPSKVP